MPNRIQEVENALCGSMEMQAFMALIRRSPTLQEELQSLIPPSAICNPSHDFWNKLKRFGTWKDVTAMQILEDDYRLGFGNSFAEDLNTHSTLSHIYCYWFPQTPLTTIYVERERLFLSAVGEYFEGPEVTPVLCAIITEALQEKTKTAQKRKARELIVRAFHVRLCGFRDGGFLLGRRRGFGGRFRRALPGRFFCRDGLLGRSLFFARKLDGFQRQRRQYGGLSRYTYGLRL